MEDPRWLRLITIGLVLAAVAVGYFLFTGRFSSNSVTKPKTQGSQTVPAASPSATPASPTPVSAYSRIVSRSQGQGAQNVETLPRTGFPAGLTATLSVSIMLAGWGLRRFPH